MTTAADHADTLASLLAALRSTYDLDEYAPRDDIEEFVLSFLLWEAPANKAENALKRVRDAVVDFNELRVHRAPEIAAMLGKTYPRAEERAERLRRSLNELFRREHEVSLQRARAAGKRDARKYLETLEGMPPYAAARILLVVLGGHAVPVDERLLAKLAAAGAVEPDADVARATAFLERHVKAAEALEVHRLFQRYADDSDAPEPADAQTSKRKSSSGSKKSSGSKAPRRRTSSKKS